MRVVVQTGFHCSRIPCYTSPMSRRTPILQLVLLALLLLPIAAHGQDAVQTPITVDTQPLGAETQPCLQTFVTSALPHYTAVENDTVRMFDANGAGVAAGDLDGDGDLDLLFGNQDGADTLLWNLGQLRFRAEKFSTGNTRDVKLVDVDGDGRLDAVLTRNTGVFNYFHNDGQTGR